MATPAAALKKMREICLAFPDTTEGSHHGKTAFYVKKKLFATCGKEGGEFAIALGLELEHASMLVENDPRFTAYPRDARGVVIAASKVSSWPEIRALLKESYGLRVPQPKKSVAKKKPAR